MDRLTRSLAGCGLALLATATGCRSTHDEVPPGRPFRNNGGQSPPVGLSTSPHTPPITATQSVGGAPGNIGSGGDPTIRPTPGDLTGSVPGARFGGPGTSGAQGGSTSGLGQPPSIPPPDITQTGGMAPPTGSYAPPTRQTQPSSGLMPPAGGQLPAPGNDPSWGNTPPSTSSSSAWGGPAAKSAGGTAGGPTTPRDQSYLNGFPNNPPASGSMGNPGQPPSPL
jgi:hypothetical protein